MSGPKVIRIVTREELSAICNGLIAQVKNALAVCERDASRSQVLDSETSTRWRSDVSQLEQLLSRDDFQAVQKQAPRLIATIRHEMSAMIEERHSAESAARRRTTSIKHTARQLLAQLQGSQISVSQELTQRLNDVVAGNLSIDQMEEVVALGIRSLPQSNESVLTQEQKEILHVLSDDNSIRTFDDWLAASRQEDPQIKQLNRFLNQLAACGAVEASNLLEVKFEKVYRENDSQRRQMLIDSLSLEAAATVREEQQHTARCQAVADVRSAILASGDGEICREALQRLEAALSQRNSAAIDAEMRTLHKLHGEAIQKRTAQASRNALLKGLKELGYTVTEGMTTIWNQQKSLVVRHPGKKGTAVELGAVGQNNQFQARVVAVQNETREAKTDRQIETEWCESLAQIQNQVAHVGAELRIERAIAAGQNPLKVIQYEAELSDATHHLEKSQVNERKL